MPVDTVRTLAEGIMADVTEDLAALVRIPSCAFPGFPAEPVMQTAEAVADLLERYGVPGARLLDVPGGYPAVFAEIAAPPGAPTILLYAHYDIQPAPLEQGWDMDPFEPEIRAGRMYGRGASDDKSGVMIIATALRLFGGQPPVGIKVLIEGEEEKGSNLDTIIAANPELVRCDAFVINDGGNMKAGELELTAALRGIAACDVTVRTLKGMAHSGSYGGAAPDALMALIRILDNLLDEHGDVAIPGLTRFEWEGGGIPEDDYRAAAGVLPGVELIGTGTLATRLWSKPSVTAIGLDAPSTEAASNSLIPEAKARVSLRIAPGSDPEESVRLLMEHLHASAPCRRGVRHRTEGHRLRWHHPTPDHVAAPGPGRRVRYLGPRRRTLSGARGQRKPRPGRAGTDDRCRDAAPGETGGVASVETPGRLTGAAG
jgi:acetylornithine deacetylase/succinyl-diaminopimelate desuccinylase-like protein